MNREHAKAIAPFVKAFGDGEDIWLLGSDKWVKTQYLYFDQPPERYHIGDKPPTPDGSARVRELLKSGKPVICGVAEGSQLTADSRADAGYLTHIIHSCDENGFYLIDRTPFKYACQVDPTQFAWEDKE